ncbi:MULTISPECIES: lipopolysaccharide transport periplasmic protein LptA [Marichromatium]|uniref:Lipopolysaccharide export system protein LptA n=1 Tax=Marichromatium gracile TaxID=1048 RepID=A0A4R4ADT1_MARGR|nr:MULTISPECIES: lipopolysaccharide transport periplasmic protein LptA [Marichromatium]MBK1708993.1 lipopolysaccharide transport periplasmic protein LptA [Marichromatium gracile]MBO8084514.1 lipopolysaccharide transport periplasmic protein LptA [Marichromatium sp.]RNE91645.1 lipopolysaccharide transport periplasmic protein LptA [Marichromatium sp. AB31]TCW36879.1 lipopolysaccharide export system protein LptA [Marichromatium gracile]
MSPPLRLLALLLLFGWNPANALDDDPQQPMYIEADDVEVREAEGTSIYVGNVEVTQGSMRLHADHMTVYHREDRRPRQIIAIGTPARFRQLLEDDQGEVRAFARRMEFDTDRDELVLIDEAVLIQGEDRVASERIVYDRAREHFRAGGSGRVRITITPEEES